MAVKTAWVRFDAEGYKRLYRLDPYGTFYIRRPVAGSRNLSRESLDTKDFAEAVTLYEQRIGKDPVVSSDKQKKSFSEVWDEFLGKTTLQSASLAKHKSTWENHCADLARGPITSFNRDWVNNVLTVCELKTSKHTKRKLSPSMLKSVKAACGAFGSYCVAEGYLTSNPAANLLPRVWMTDKQKMRKSTNVVEIRAIRADEVVKASEVELIVDAFGDFEKDHVFVKQRAVQLWPLVGLRIAEMLALCTTDILDDPETYGDNGCLLVERQLHFDMKVDDQASWFDERLKMGNKTRRVPLSDGARMLLDSYLGRGLEEGWLQRGGLLFPNPATGQPYTKAMFGKTITKAAADAGIKRPITSHYLRHTYASRLLTSGVEIGEVAEYMGNSAKVIKERYDHFIKMGERANRVAAALDAWVD